MRSACKGREGVEGEILQSCLERTPARGLHLKGDTPAGCRSSKSIVTKYIMESTQQVDFRP